MARSLILLLLAPFAALAIDGEDYLHGGRQFQQLLADRPALSSQLVDDDPLAVWAIAQFAGARTGFRIFWDAALPPDGVDAQHRQPMTGPPAILIHHRVQTGPRFGQAKTFAQLWADLVFELHNIAQSPRFERAYIQATAGQIDYHGWLEAVTRAEHRALIETAQFYRTRWRPWVRERGLDPAHPRWRAIMAVPVQYPEWIRGYTDPGGYPFEPYGRYYSEHLWPMIRAAGLDWRINPFRPHPVARALQSP